MSAQLIVEPPVSLLDAEIRWLKDRGVPASRLAALFDTTPNNIRQLVFRARHRKRIGRRIPEALQTIGKPFDSLGELAHPLPDLLGIRREEDSVLHYKPQRRKIDRLEEEVEKIIDGFFGTLSSGEGLARLRSFIPRIGRPAHFRLVRLLARIRFQIAVTEIHLGRATSAVRQGLESLHLCRRAYQSSGDWLDLRRAAHSAAVVSQAYALRFEPDQARNYLELQQSILATVHESAPPELCRQLAVLSFQEGDFDGARKHFETAKVLWEEKAQRSGEKLLHEVPNFGSRQSNILPPVNWESSLEVLDEVQRMFPPGHIQIAMNVSWTAATGLATNSSAVQQQALDLLRTSSSAFAGYGHQATIRRLLSLTPELRPTLRPHWARRVLYANAFRNQ